MEGHRNATQRKWLPNLHLQVIGSVHAHRAWATFLEILDRPQRLRLWRDVSIQRVILGPPHCCPCPIFKFPSSSPARYGFPRPALPFKHRRTLARPEPESTPSTSLSGSAYAVQLTFRSSTSSFRLPRPRSAPRRTPSTTRSPTRFKARTWTSPTNLS